LLVLMMLLSLVTQKLIEAKFHLKL
jgi:hypothetical protein